MSTPDWSTPWTLTPLLTVEVRGLPIPQGSIRSLGAGRPSVHSNAKTLLPWRETIQHAIEAEVWDRTDLPDNLRITGPVALELIFTLPKPTSRPKRKRCWPNVRPDLDKLARTALDALTNSGAVEDDGQVVQLLVVKTYPGEHPQAMPVPGLRARLALVHDGSLELPSVTPPDPLDAGGLVDVPLPELEEEEAVPW